MKPDKQGAHDAGQGKGMAKPQSFGDDASRKQYEAAYKREQERLEQQRRGKK